ncbi:hypothetical protein ScPMuIL_016394 [Solemya velum]
MWTLARVKILSVVKIQSMWGCVYCDPVLRPLIEKHHAMARRSNRGRGGGRGGRGGRGRGRGRGRGKPKDKMAQLAAYFV